jgi:putative colanic acid biosynthesis acetyltransferase WcaF
MSKPTNLPSIDTAAHRKNQNYPKGVLFARVLWGLLQPLFRWSPRVCYGWRNFLLRLMGAKIGRNVRIYPSAHIFYPWRLIVGNDVIIGWDAEIYSLGTITIGDAVIISQRAHLCAGSHDYMQAHLPLLRPPITIESGCWICADSFIGPGHTVGAGSVVAGRAVVVKDVPPNTLVGGNPARSIRSIER